MASLTWQRTKLFISEQLILCWGLLFIKMHTCILQHIFYFKKFQAYQKLKYSIMNTCISFNWIHHLIFCYIFFLTYLRDAGLMFLSPQILYYNSIKNQDIFLQSHTILFHPKIQYYLTYNKYMFKFPQLSPKCPSQLSLFFFSMIWLGIIHCIWLSGLQSPPLEECPHLFVFHDT